MTSAPSTCAAMTAACGERKRLVTTRGGRSPPGRHHRRRAGAERTPTAGSATAAAAGLAVDDERDVHRPVRPAGLAELVGAVERVDDPHPVGGQPVARSRGPPRRGWRRPGRASWSASHEEVVGAHVALVHDLPRVGAGRDGLGPQLDEQLAGLVGQPGGQLRGRPRRSRSARAATS